MYKKALHKIISVFVVLTVLLPMSLQFAHSLEVHSHEVCKEKIIQHIHANEVDCEFDHYLFKTNASLVVSSEQLSDSQFNTSTLNHFEKAPNLNSLFPTLSRGSPIAII